MKSSQLRSLIVVACVAVTLLTRFSAQAAQIVLLTDTYDVENTSSATFNNDNAITQSGTLSPVAYTLRTLSGSPWISQHGNAGSMLFANEGVLADDIGGSSLNRDFALDANPVNLSLKVSFNIVEVSSFTDSTRWVQFNLSGAQNLPVADGIVGFGLFFRQNGQGAVLSAGADIGSFSWTANDLVSLTVSSTLGSGSAFNGNGTKVVLSVGANNIGTYSISQQSAAYATFSAYNYSNDRFGVGKFDNLSVSLVPEPSTYALLALAAAGFGANVLRRRRK